MLRTCPEERHTLCMKRHAQGQFKLAGTESAATREEPTPLSGRPCGLAGSTGAGPSLLPHSAETASHNVHLRIKYIFANEQKRDRPSCYCGYVQEGKQDEEGGQGI